MKILLLSHYYAPEIGAPQARLGEMAAVWSRDGDDVTVLTGMPNHPTGIIHSEYKGRVRVDEERDGVHVKRCWLYATPNEGFLKRTLGHLTFAGSSVLLGFRRVGKPDVVIVSSPTFFLIGSGWLLAKLKRTKFVVEIRDLWPAILVELGVLTNRRIIRILEILELAAYRAADAVVVVTEGFRQDLVSRGIPAQKVSVIRNGVDLERFQPSDSYDPAIRARLGANAVEAARNQIKN